MKDGIKIIGMEETMAVLDQIREDFPRKVAVSAIKNSMKPFVKEIVKANSDVPETKKVTKSRTLRAAKDIAVSTGVWSDKGAVKHRSSRSKKPVRVFSLIYWRNYGTLSNRNPMHRFVRSRRPKSRDWKGGIVGTGNIEKAWESIKGAVVNNLPAEARKAFEKYLLKRQKR
ncbi:hypothetical protein [Odoribacter splanchnicus]|jgi:hypothetical protein|uniref:hypothetical protein n=1 Tax=Odoribacter splanchnicus TaxID=28118 RepID=UPI003079226D